MNFFTKMMSTALSTAIVLGCGASLQADTSLKISTTFPDAGMQKIVSQYDTNKDGYLNSTENSNIKTLYNKSTNANVKSLSGLETLTSCATIVLDGCDIVSIDLNSYPLIQKIQLKNCYSCTSFKGSKTLTSIDFVNCPKLSSIDLASSTELNNVVISGLLGFTGTLDLSNQAKLKDVYIASSNLRYVNFSNQAKLRNLEIEYTDLRCLDLSKCIALSSLKYLGIYDNQNFGSIQVPGEIFMILINNRVGNVGYSYTNGTTTIKIGVR